MNVGSFHRCFTKAYVLKNVDKSHGKVNPTLGLEWSFLFFCDSCWYIPMSKNINIVQEASLPSNFKISSYYCWIKYNLKPIQERFKPQIAIYNMTNITAVADQSGHKCIY